MPSKLFGVSDQNSANVCEKHNSSIHNKANIRTTMVQWLVVHERRQLNKVSLIRHDFHRNRVSHSFLQLMKLLPCTNNMGAEIFFQNANNNYNHLRGQLEGAYKLIQISTSNPLPPLSPLI